MFPVPATFLVRIDTLWCNWSLVLTSDVYLTNYLDPSGKVKLGWGIILSVH